VNRSFEGSLIKFTPLVIAPRKIVFAVTPDGPAPYGIFIVSVDTPGVTLSAYPLVDGTRAGDVELIDVRVASESLLAVGNNAVAAVEEAIDSACVALLAQTVGAMEAAVSLTSDYAKERKQFSQSIGKFQAIQHMASDMFVATYEARSALYQQLAAQNVGVQARRRALSVARAIVAAAGKVVGHNGIQIHGGYGITDEYAISHYWRRLYAVERLYGDSDFHLERLANMGAADKSE